MEGMISERVLFNSVALRRSSGRKVMYEQRGWVTSVAIFKIMDK